MQTPSKEELARRHADKDATPDTSQLLHHLENAPDYQTRIEAPCKNADKHKLAHARRDRRAPSVQLFGLVGVREFIASGFFNLQSQNV